jgi:flagellin
MTFQVGVAGGAGNQVVLSLRSMTLAALSLDHGNANVNTMTAAQNALDQVGIALSRLNTRRSQMAATFTQLQASFDVSANDREALLNTLNVIRDTDYAVESTNLAQNQIRSQAAVSILSQANTIPQLALQLLQG